MRYNPDEVLLSNWQNDLTFGIERIQEKLEDALRRVGNNPEAKKTRKARENISRFVDTYNHEYPDAAEPEWSRAGSP